ncbi:MAG: hypothetical protein CVU44_00875 [Chloroflexi bacterium HGW-Chloroflexi-6]|nr:MAG: hypothetical protein CVU44_00875 [Chloroflexi bacterium HGW-Chloroflexi-6]
MNMRHEAILWSRAIAVAIVLGLAVVWAVIALAFSRPNLAPLYFAAAPYRQDDYSAEGEYVMRLNPLDPALEQEAIIEDLARGNPVFDDIDLNPASTNIALSPTSTSVRLPTRTSIPPLTSTSIPLPTSTSIPPPTSTSVPPPTSTSAPTPTSTTVPPPTKPPKPPKPPKPTKPPRPEKPLKPG